MQTLNSEENNWKVPHDPHVTTLFVGRRKLSPEKQEILDNFKEGVSYPMTLHAIVYAPGKILTGVTMINRENVQIDNDFDHITMMCAPGTKPVWSNDILQACFSSGAPGEEDYANKFEGVDGFKEYSVTIKGETLKAYVIIPARLTLFYGKTKCMM